MLINGWFVVLQSRYVMCKLYQALSSETAIAVREAAKGEAERLKVLKDLAAAECKANTQKEMSKASMDKLEYLRQLEVKTVAKANNLVAERNGVARRELMKLQQSRNN